MNTISPVEGRVYLFTGSKNTGGFCVTRKGMFEPPQLGHILVETPVLKDYSAKQGEFIKYKGRSYTWVDIADNGKIVLTNEMLSFLKIEPGIKLLSIRSSNIAFTMGAYGRLVEESIKHEDEIPTFQTGKFHVVGNVSVDNFGHSTDINIIVFRHVESVVKLT